MEKKHRHHFVWGHYLEAWTVEGLLWCERGDRRFRNAPRNVAWARDFYRPVPLSEADLSFLLQLIGRMGPQVRPFARALLRDFATVGAAARLLDEITDRDSANARELEATIHNFEENLHAAIEARSIHILDQLRDRAAPFLASDAEFSHFTLYIAAQSLRTPRIPHFAAPEATELLSGLGVNPEAVWAPLRMIFASNTSITLAPRRRSVALTFLDAAEGCEFITGDQPVINLRAGVDRRVPPVAMELYYPLGPRHAVIVDFDGTTGAVDRRRVPSDRVHDFNRRMAASGGESLYAATEHGLASATSK